MKTPAVIEALGALAHEHRLAIYRLLVQRGPEACRRAIGQRIGLLPSSLTFHLQNLQRAGLITQRRESRQLFYSVDFSVMNGLVGYLTENCCGNSGADCAVLCAGYACEGHQTCGQSRLKPRPWPNRS
jgi:ArsR family transcriptional regulator